MKNIKRLIPLFFLTLFFRTYCNASSLTLTNIGALDTQGKTYSEWRYTEKEVLLKGNSSDTSAVTVKIGDTSYQAEVLNGTWSQKISKDTGDYPVEITQGSEKISFTLHLGQNIPESNTTAASAPVSGTTPVTGYNQIIAISFSLGVILLASYFYFWGDTRKRSVFEAKILKED